MDNNLNNDLLTGSIKKNLLRVALPTMLGFFLQAVYDIVDMIWIGRISSQAVAGVTIFSTVFWLVTILNEIIGTSSISLITQSYGMKDEKRTQRIIEQTLVFKAMVAIISALIMFVFLKPLLSFFTTEEEVLKAALDYGYIRIFFLPIMFSSYSVNTALRCLGDAKTPMFIMIAASVANIILDPLFMFQTIPGTSIPGLNMGVFGAALATVISTVIAFSLGFFILLRGKAKMKIDLKGLFKLDWSIDKKLLTIGLPSGIEMLSRNLSAVFTLKFVSIYGTNTVAAMGIGGRLFNFAFMPIMGIAMGSSTIVGQCLGAEDVERAKDTAKFGAFVNFVMMTAVSILAIIFPKQLMKIFIDDINVINVGKPMVQIITPALIGGGIAMGLGSVFSGSGHNTPFLLSSLISRWGVQVPLLFLTTKIFNLSALYVWISFLIADAIEMIIVFIAYRKGKWETYRV